MVLGYLTGIFPRSERLIESTRKQSPELKQLFAEEKRKVISLQIRARLSHIADPLLDWDDMFRPFTERCKAIRKGALDRFFENNTFYRKPIVVDELRSERQILSTVLCTKLLPKHGKWKIDLPDPYTFAQLAENRYYRDSTALMSAYADFLAEEVRGLSQDGFSLFQLNAPSLASIDRKTLAHEKDCVERIFKSVRGKAERVIHLYFSDSSGIIPSLLDFEIDAIGIDFRATPLRKVEGIKFTKGLVVGYIDAQNTRMESPKQIADFAVKCEETLSPRKIGLSTNCDLEFIPYSFAARKVLRLGKALQVLREMGLDH